MEGIEIRIARIREGLRQVDIAHGAGISQPALSRIERGELIPSQKTLHSIMTAISEKTSLHIMGR